MTKKQRCTEAHKIRAHHIATGFCVAALLAVAMYITQTEYGRERVSQRAKSDASQIVEITGGFVQTYAIYGAKYTNGSLPSPASFRADALGHIENRERDDGSFKTGVIGLPGREIVATTIDDTTRKQLLKLEAAPSLDVIDSIVEHEKTSTHQSLWAFYATAQACADCHNRLQNLSGDKRWKLGDFMGAQIVERDITSLLASARNNTVIQSLLLFSALFAAWMSCLYLKNHFRLTHELKTLATTDSLTGCINRRELQERINNLEGSTDGALLMLDLDKFKTINDTYGHNAGDEVIKDFSNQIRGQIREEDWVARFGGEEFVIWLPNIKPVDAIRLAERIREQVEAGKVVTADSTCIQYTVSIGLKIVQDESPTRFESWLKTADQLLYRAKNEGRNKLVCGAV